MKYMKYTNRIILSAMAVLFLSASPALAWNCSTPGQVRVQVPTGTTGPSGDGPGSVVVDNGLTFECMTLPTTGPSQTQNQNQNQQQNQSQNSNATAQGGNSKSSSTAQGGNATGGSVSGSGNSQNTLKNSGNSTNTNTVTAGGGAGGQGGSASATGGSQKQVASSAASNNGNGSNDTNYQSSTVVHAAAATAFAQAAPTAPCVIGYGAGGQLIGGGLSFSGGKVDKNCAILETARSVAVFGSDIAYCKILITDKWAKKAGVTMEDCLARKAAVADSTIIAAPQPVIDTYVPPVVVPTPEPQPVVTTTSEQRFPLGSCQISNGLGNRCSRFLDDAIRRLQSKPDAKLRFLAPPVDGPNVIAYLRGKIDSSRVLETFSDDQNNSLTLEVVWQN